MVDVIKNNVFDTLSRFSQRDNHRNESILSFVNLNQFVENQKAKRQLTKEAEAKVKIIY